MSWLSIWRSCSFFFRKCHHFYRLSLSLIVKFSERKRTNHLDFAGFETEPLIINNEIFHKSLRRCSFRRNGIVKYIEFSLPYGPFFNLNNFWYSRSTSIKFGVEQNFQCYLSNTRLVLLIWLVVTKSYLLRTTSVGKHHKVFKLTIIWMCLK